MAFLRTCSRFAWDYLAFFGLAAFDMFHLCLTLQSLVVNNDELLILLQINEKKL